MGERQKNTPTPDSTAAFERQRKRKVVLVAAVGSCLVIGFIWFLFKPAPTIGKGQAGINTTLPDGKAPKIEGDKRKAAERVASEEQSRNRMMTLGDNSFSLLDEELRNTEPQSPTEDPVRRAAEANRAMQQQARQFYAAPSRNAEVEELREQVASLQQQLDIERQQPDPMEVAEEQYRLAQRYLGGGDRDFKRGRRCEILGTFQRHATRPRGRCPGFDPQSADRLRTGAQHRVSDGRRPSAGGYGSDHPGLRRADTGRACRFDNRPPAAGAGTHRRRGHTPQYAALRRRLRNERPAAGDGNLHRIPWAHLPGAGRGV